MTRRWVWMLIGALNWGGVALAGRPLLTNDAEPVEVGKLQVETGVGYVSEDSTNRFDVPLNFTLGVLPGVEAGVGFGGQFQDHDENGETAFEEGLSDLTLGVKWKLLEQKDAFFDQAISGSVKLPTADRDRGLGTGKVDYDLTYILTRQINDEVGALFNLGYTWLGDDEDSDVVHYGPALTYQLTRKLQPVTELILETPVDGSGTSAGINGGFRYQLTEPLMLDAALGTHLAGDWPDWTATVGLTWTF